MSKVVIVARTRMQSDHVCIGGHDLGWRFRGVRLLDRFGGHWSSEAPFVVGDIWNMRYEEKGSARPPHVEDVCVMKHERVGQVQDLKGLILKRARTWVGSADALYSRTVRVTPSGASYVPAKGRLPRCSTGYWLPDEDLEQRRVRDRVRFVMEGEADNRSFPWVGVQEPPPRIEKGSLVRVSLSRLFSSETAPEGYYVQISGVL